MYAGHGSTVADAGHTGIRRRSDNSGCICAGRRDGNKKWRGCCDSIRTGNHTGDTNL